VLRISGNGDVWVSERVISHDEVPSHSVSITASRPSTAPMPPPTSPRSSQSRVRSLLGAIRAANRREMPRLPRRDNGPTPQPAAIHPERGQVERALRTLNITEPALLARTAIINDAARDLITEATAKHRRIGGGD